MKRRLPELQNKLRRLAFSALLFSLLLISYSAYASSGVLVTSKESTISRVDRKDLRRIFLGIKPPQSLNINRPVINLSNKETYQLFLKKILFMTEGGYKRKLIKRVFRQGADEIQSISSASKLEEHLRSNPNDISFMSEEEAKQHPDLKIIQALW